MLGIAAAELRWSTVTAVHEAGAGQASYTTEFAFENAGDRPVTIESVRTSCGCTAAELEKTVYRPGEAGVIAATFSFGSRTGRQVKHITVRTDAPGSPATTLTMRVTIPRVLAMQPRSLVWRAGNAAGPRRMEIEVLAGEVQTLALAGGRIGGYTAPRSASTPRMKPVGQASRGS
jgi:hypothetical protein